MRARDLFFAMWTSDLFMKRVQENGKWTLMCPSRCPGLYDVYGEEFEKCILAMKRQARKKNNQSAGVVGEDLESQIETGTPYMLYKDAVNRVKSKEFRNYSFVICVLKLWSTPLLMRLLFVI
jgi:ribonucleoside-diphosphate reductase alpha chain